MNKAGLTELTAKSMTASKAESERWVSAVLDGIRGGLKKGEQVQLIGFGTFRVRKNKARKGRNPRTGATIQIKASKTVTFRAGKDLKKSL